MPQGYSSQAGHVLLRSQAVQGTYQADTPTAGIAIPLRGNAGLGSDRSLMIPDPEVGGNRDIANGYLGPVKWSGGYDFYARVNSLLPLLKSCLGVAGLVTTTGVTTHTITGSDGATLPLLSIEEQVGASGLECYSYTDAVVNTLHLECAADGYVMGTAGLIAAMQIAGVTPANVTTLLDTTPMLVGTNVTVTLNGVTLPAKSFSLDINNNIDDGDFRLGSFYVGSLLPKRREVTASVVIRQQDSTLWRQAVYGLSTATQSGGVKTSQPLVITISSYESIPGGTPTTSYSLAFTIPAATLQPYGLGPNSDSIIEPTLAIQAFRPAPATAIMTTVAKTGLAAIN